jgi:hypothetical protein
MDDAYRIVRGRRASGRKLKLRFLSIAKSCSLSAFGHVCDKLLSQHKLMRPLDDLLHLIFPKVGVLILEKHLHLGAKLASVQRQCPEI